MGIYLVLDPSGSGKAGCPGAEVTGVSGSGPSTVSLHRGFSFVEPAGALVMGALAGDGLHGGTYMHATMVAPVIAAAKAAGLFVP